MTESKEKSLLTAFLDRTGYEPADVISKNDRTRAVVTSNGGKYQVLKSGKVRTLSGPKYPKEEAE